MTSTQPPTRPLPRAPSSAVSHLLLDYLSYPTIRTILFLSRRRFSAEIFVSLPSSSSRLAAAGCALSFKRTDRQAYEISYPVRLFLVTPPPPRPFPRVSASLRSFPLFLFPPRSFPFRSMHSPRLYRLKDVDSASNPLSIPPFGNPAPLTPPPPTPFDATLLSPSFVYPTYEAKNSILWYRLGRLL